MLTCDSRKTEFTDRRYSYRDRLGDTGDNRFDLFVLVGHIRSCHFCCKVYNYFLYAATAGLSKTNRYTFDLKSDICNWRAGNVPFREIFVLCDIGLFYYIIGLKI